MRLNLLTLRLLLIKFGLKLRRHAVVSVLGFLQVESNLMHVRKGVQVLMFVQHLLRLFFVVAGCVVHQENSALVVVILAFESLIFLQLFINCHNELLLHLRV